jgi:hypothetical protein
LYVYFISVSHCCTGICDDHVYYILRTNLHKF